jgi:transposase
VSLLFKNELPTAIIARLNHTIYSAYIKEKSQYFSGERSVRSYKSDLPVPFSVRNIHNLRYDSELKNFRFSLFDSDKYCIPFKTYLGKDLSNNKVIIDRCISGEYKLCDSSIRIEKGKIYLYLSIQQPISIKQLDPQIKVDAELSFLVPILVKLNDKQYNIGDKGSYIYKRLTFQHAFSRMQQAMKYNKGGKGRVQKLQGMERLKDKEKNFINSFSHTISHELIKFCLLNNAGKLELKNITQTIEEARENPFVYRNWSYGNLRDKIAYKCKMNNIQLIID